MFAISSKNTLLFLFLLLIKNSYIFDYSLWPLTVIMQISPQVCYECVHYFVVWTNSKKTFWYLLNFQFKSLRRVLDLSLSFSLSLCVLLFICSLVCFFLSLFLSFVIPFFLHSFLSSFLSLFVLHSLCSFLCFFFRYFVL